MNRQNAGTVLTAELEKEWAAMVKNVRSGDTTGNRLKDFVIARYPKERLKEIESLYLGLNEAVQLHQGEHALIVVKKEVPVDSDGRALIHHVCLESPKASIISERLYLGIISGPELIFRLDDPEDGGLMPALYPDDSCEIPTGGRRAFCWDPRNMHLASLNLEATTSFPLDWTWDLAEINQPINIKNDELKKTRSDPADLALEIIIGSDLLKQWLDQRSIQAETFKELSRLLLNRRF